MEGLKKKSREFNFRLRKKKRMQFFKQSRLNLIEKMKKEQRQKNFLSEFVLEETSPVKNSNNLDGLITIRVRIQNQNIVILLFQNGKSLANHLEFSKYLRSNI